MGRDNWESMDLAQSRVRQAEPKARNGGEQPNKDKRHNWRRSLARKDDAEKGNSEVKIASLHLTTLSFDQTATPSPSPGRMSTIPLLPGSATVVSPESSTSLRNSRPTPPPEPTPGTPAAIRTTPTGRPRFFASGRPHPGSDRGGAINFFRTHGRNGGSAPALPAFAITLIVIGAVFMVFAVIAAIFCCRVSARRRKQGSGNGTRKNAKIAPENTDAESVAPGSVRHLQITKVPELEGTPRTESRYGPLAPVVPELHGRQQPSELR